MNYEIDYVIGINLNQTSRFRIFSLADFSDVIQNGGTFQNLKIHTFCLGFVALFWPLLTLTVAILSAFYRSHTKEFYLLFYYLQENFTCHHLSIVSAIKCAAHPLKIVLTLGHTHCISRALTSCGCVFTKICFINGHFPFNIQNEKFDYKDSRNQQWIIMVAVTCFHPCKY